MEKSKIKNQKSKTQIKIQNFGLLIVILIFEFWILNFGCFAQTVSSKDLIDRAKEYDGKTVSYQGEVIGDIMRRGDFVWINVNDGIRAIGVWVKADLTKTITRTGSYKFSGDTIFVEGKFNRSCLQHGGDLDIHADSLTIIKQGYPIEERVSIRKIRATIGFLAIVLCLGILRLLRKGPKKK